MKLIDNVWDTLLREFLMWRREGAKGAFAPRHEIRRKSMSRHNVAWTCWKNEWGNVQWVDEWHFFNFFFNQFADVSLLPLFDIIISLDNSTFDYELYFDLLFIYNTFLVLREKNPQEFSYQNSFFQFVFSFKMCFF